MPSLFRLMVVLWLAALTPRAWAQEWTTGPPIEQTATDLPRPPEGWTEVPGAWLTVHGHPDRTDLLLRVARHAAASLPAIAEQLQVPIGGTIHVYVARTEAQFRELQPGQAPTWADATAYPAMGAVFLRDPRIRIATDEPVTQVLDHELTHILLGRAFAPEIPPSWLQEGVAQIVAGQTGLDTVRTLSSAALQGTFMPLESLERRFPRDRRLARVAYAESADFIQHLQVAHGEGVVATLVHASLGGRSLSSTVQEVTGAPLDEVERSWRAQWGTTQGVGAGFLGNLGDWLFGLGAVLLLVGGILRRRRFRRRLVEMEQEEAIVDALMADLRSQRMSS